MKALKQQSGDKLAGIVLDLRNNPGGLLDQAVAVSNAFLDQGEIVSIKRPPDPGQPALSRPSPGTTSCAACRWWC